MLAAAWGRRRRMTKAKFFVLCVHISQIINTHWGIDETLDSGRQHVSSFREQSGGKVVAQRRWVTSHNSGLAQLL